MRDVKHERILGAQTQTLAEFLLERIAAREAAAEVVADNWADPTWRSGWYEYGEDWTVSVEGSGCVAEKLMEEDALFIAANDPAYVLADCAAKRRIVELHRPYRYANDFQAAVFDSLEDAQAADADRDWDDDCSSCGRWDEYPVASPCPTLRALALPYVDHPDFREEWRA